MVEYRILVSRQAAKDFKKLKAAGLEPKFKKLYDILKINPFQEYPRYETLVGNLKGCYSRRINIQHRLIYDVDKKKKVVRILRCWTHYEK